MYIAPTETITLLSTVVAPAFAQGSIDISPVDAEQLPALLAQVSRNLCGHPVTDTVLRAIYPALPALVREFWDGRGVALAVRPRGGVRGSTKEGDTPVTLADLEAVTVRWRPQRWTIGEGERVICDQCNHPIASGQEAVREHWSDGSGFYSREAVIHVDKEHCRRFYEVMVDNQHTLRRVFAARRGITFSTPGHRYAPTTPEMRETWEAQRWDIETECRAAVFAHVETGVPLPVA